MGLGPHKPWTGDPRYVHAYVELCAAAWACVEAKGRPSYVETSAKRDAARAEFLRVCDLLEGEQVDAALAEGVAVHV